MYRKDEVDCSFAELVTLFFTVEFNVTKLATLSTAKHFKYSMKYTDLGMEFKRHTKSVTNVQFPSNCLRMSPKMYF